MVDKRMKKKYFIFGMLAVLLLLVLCIVFFVAQYEIYELTPQVCAIMFYKDITPERFVETQGADTLLEGNHTRSWVNSEGNLMLLLHQDEVEQWKSSNGGLRILATIWKEQKDIGIPVIDFDADYGKDAIGQFERHLDEGAVNCGLNLSDDYTQIVEPWGKSSIYAPWFIHMSVAMQLFDGVPSEEIRVEYVRYDENGEEWDRFVVWSHAEENHPLP